MKGDEENEAMTMDDDDRDQPAAPARRRFLGGVMLAVAGAAFSATVKGAARGELADGHRPRARTRWIGHC
jgi:hypothetical protein